MITEDPKVLAREPSLAGLGGWLALVGLGLCVAPLRLLAVMAANATAFQPDVWGMLTTPGTDAYHPFWAPVIIGETIANLFLLGLSLVNLYLFFRKRRVFPRMAITFLAAGVVITALDLLAAQAIPMAKVAPKDVAQLGQTVVGAAVWIPYFLRSRRVRETFVR
jgi:Protein of unknown function (DUF2569)